MVPSFEEFVSASTLTLKLLNQHWPEKTDIGFHDECIGFACSTDFHCSLRALQM